MKHNENIMGISWTIMGISWEYHRHIPWDVFLSNLHWFLRGIGRENQISLEDPIYPINATGYLVVHPTDRKWVSSPYLEVDDLPPQKSHENHQGQLIHDHDSWDEHGWTTKYCNKVPVLIPRSWNSSAQALGQVDWKIMVTPSIVVDVMVTPKPMVYNMFYNGFI